MAKSVLFFTVLYNWSFQFQRKPTDYCPTHAIKLKLTKDLFAPQIYIINGG